ncbi:Hypothetical protein PBC10988_37310 [Planctomycetales bacterium 10988]|nr:Hypothetical protein PBC10988_37310 [Planctomycetales bacterium 10988]
MKVWRNVWLGICLLTLVGTWGCSGGGSSSSGPSASFAVRVADAEKLGNPTSQAIALHRIAEDQIAAGALFDVRSTLRKAYDACLRIENPAEKADLLVETARIQREGDQRSDSVKSVESAELAVVEIDDLERRVVVLSKIAELQTAAGKVTEALETLEEAEGLFPQIADPYSQVLAQLAVAKGYAEADPLSQRTPDLIGEANNGALSLNDPRQKTEALAEVAAIQQVLGLEDDAKSTFDQGFATAENIEEPESQAYAYLSLAERLKKLGDSRWEDAFEQAEEITDTIQDMGIKNGLLEQIQRVRQAN